MPLKSRARTNIRSPARRNSLQFGLGRLLVLTAGTCAIVALMVAYSQEPNYISAPYDVPILLAGIALVLWLTRLNGRAKHR